VVDVGSGAGRGLTGPSRRNFLRSSLGRHRSLRGDRGGGHDSLQFWDADPTEMSIESDDRDIPRLADTAQPGVMYDRSFLDGEAAGLVAELGAILESKPVMVSPCQLAAT